MRKKLHRSVLSSLLCLVLCVAAFIGTSITSTADVAFPYTVAAWQWQNGGLLTSALPNAQTFSAEQFEYNHSQIISLTNTSGNLVGTKNYRILINFNPNVSVSGNNTNSDVSVVYSVICGGNVYEFGNSNWCYFDVSGVNTDYLVFQAHVYAAVNPAYSISSSSRPSFSYVLRISDFSYNVIETSGIANPDLNQINDTIDDGNEIAQDTNDTIHGFFGDFFDNLFDMVYGLFIPESDYFTNYFNRLNASFTHALGALWQPVSWLIDFLGQLMVMQSSVTTTIYFPEIQWEGMTIIGGQDVQIIPDGFADLQQKCFFVSDVIMVGAVFYLLQLKIKEVLDN